MTGSLVRSAISFVALVVAYQVYALLVVPRVEPPGIERSGETISTVDRESSGSAIERYQQFLSAYFPSGHWSLGSPPPKLVRQQQIMMVLSDYKRSDDGQVEFEKCALLLLPKTWTPGSPPPRDTVIIEAPEGARFEFDEDFRPSRGQMGRIVEGELPGVVTIRSDMKEAGPHDDLFITTRDLFLYETVIHTEAPVEARLGNSRLTGTELEIRLSRDEHIARGPSINGVQSLQILRDVQMRLDAGNIDLLGEKEKPDKKPGPPDYNPPVVVTCKGRLYFDLLEFVASFEKQVEVRRERLEGPYDQLDCNHLSLRFAAVDERGMVIDIADDPNVARKQSAAAGKLQPVAVEATGTVRAEAPVEKAAARAERMHIDLLKRRITLDGGGDVMMSYGGNEVHAPFIQYTIPPKESPSVVGDLSLSGPGWLRLIPDIDRPDRVIDVVWKLAPGNPYPVQLRRERGQPVLQLTGNPAIDAHRLGRVTATRMELALREVPGDGPEGPAIEVTDSAAKLAIIPERLLAAGDVVFESPELTGRTQQMHATFEPWQKVTGPAGERKPMQLVGDRAEPTSQYDITASQMHLDLALTGRHAEPTAAVCEGGVVLKQVKTAKPGELPLEVRGDKLSIDDLDQGAKITVFGRQGAATPLEGLATVIAQGLTLSARQVHADQEKGAFWIDGGGQATMQVDGEMLGQPQGKAVPVTLSWQSKMHGEGQRIVAEGRVQVVSQQSLMQAERAIATLSRPIGVDKDHAGKVEVAEVGLEGNVVIDYRAQDPAGQQSHENLQLASISINRLTGAIDGTGPGVLRSVRYSDALGSFGDLGSADPLRPGQPRPNQSSAPKAPELRFLRVDFAQGITGNTVQRVLRFHRRVQSVYGPIAKWGDELPLHDPTRLPPETVTMRCETLVVGEDPVAARLASPSLGDKRPMGPLEVQAIGNVAIEGRNKDLELFQAEGAKATYNQAKDVVILEGDGQRDAVLRQRDPTNGRSVDTPLRKLLYYRSQSHVVMEGFQQFDFQQNAVRPQVNTPR
jgi:lipopolysaccharide export system protein LptA